VGRSVRNIPEMLMEDALATRKTFQIKDWFPGAM